MMQIGTLTISMLVGLLLAKIGKALNTAIVLLWLNVGKSTYHL
jgi:hypothetical protein